MRERVERGGCRQRAAVDRESQAVAGHGIDEACGVAGEQQAVDGGGPDIDGERTEHHRRRDEPRVREPIAKQRIARELAHQQRRGIAQIAVGGVRRLDEAHVSRPARHRRDPDVPSAAHVHFANHTRCQTGV